MPQDSVEVFIARWSASAAAERVQGARLADVESILESLSRLRIA